MAIRVDGAPLVYLAGSSELQTQLWMQELRNTLWPPSSMLLLEQSECQISLRSSCEGLRKRMAS